MSEQKPRVYYVKEHTLGSMLADTFTFASICGAFWFNYTFINGNNALDVLLFICFFMFSIGKASQIKRYVELTKEDRE